MFKRCGVIKKPWFLVCFFFCVVVVFILELRVSNFPKNDNILEQIYKKDVSGYHLPSKESTSLGTWGSRKDLIVIYNRIPKTGSTSFINVAYDICKKNSFNVIHLNITKNSHILSLADQARFIHNVTNWNAKKPALYHGHVGFIDFQKFGVQPPIYINILRKPLSRLISYYYFLRYGDNYRPHLIRKKHGNKVTFDECVKLKNPDCHPDNMWLQVPFLCGQNAFCWIPGNEWALQEAKRNLVREYLLVGVTEDIPNFISILEFALPEFFKGASEHFASSLRKYLRKTNKKIEPSEETVREIKKSKIWQMENDLYEFALQQFKFVKNHMKTSENGTVMDKGIQFKFEKIYPK
ncbi:heparin sulfate O-sulfotransferase [Planococcus citri]|uniref:heparin sulfate O-sulfotransferase n=1 Tax=Planococcus citri TaxID=170843 RepID=UPI0031F8A780